MTMVASDAGGPPHRIPPLDNALKNAFKVSPDVKRHLQPYAEPIMIEPPSPGNVHTKVDDEFVRKKLRDSLASALEMVVSKQLVNSVLGLVTDGEVGGNEAKWSVQAQLRKQDEMLVDGGVRQSNEEVRGVKRVPERNQAVNTHTDGGFGAEADVATDETQALDFRVSTAEQSGQHDSNSEVNESSSKHFERGEAVPMVGESEVNESSLKGFEREETVPMVDEGKGGLQLMEQARKVAWDIESNLFSVNGGVNKKYKEKARSLLFNLKDKSNPELRVRVFEGEIHPDILVRMSAVQLASKELCQWRIAKAEEFASMVVLTDADLDPRRIVKKTHKGEFQVVVEDSAFPAGLDSVAVLPAVPVHDKVGDEGEGGDAGSGRVGIDGVQSKLANSPSVEGRELDGEGTSPILMHETIEDEIMETGDELGTGPPFITSRDEYIGSRVEPSRKILEEPSYTEDSVQDGASDMLDAAVLETSGNRTWINSVPKSRNPETLKLSKSPSFRLAEPGSESGASFSKNREVDDGSPLWEGSLQLSTTRSASVGIVYKSGVKVELKDWPQSVEVKGRVRLAVLDKFLQDLQLSRSRTITVLSLCPSSGQVDGEQMGAYLKEIADQYRKGDRAGFAEPKPGFELYLLPTDSACLDLLPEEHRIIKGTEREDEALVGVLVWRKTQSQSPSRGVLEQKVKVKKTSMSNLVSNSPTRVNPKPFRSIEAPSLGGGLRASLETASASSLVNKSGNSSVLSAPSHGDSSATRGPPIHRDYQQPPPASTGLLLSPSVGMNRVIERPHGTLPDSGPVPQWSFDGEDRPPGFLPGPIPSFPQARSTVLNAEAKQQGLQASPVEGSVSASLASVGNREISKNTPPGFWSRSSPNFPTQGIQRICTPAQQDDDDLPEFKFEAEGTAQQTTSNYLIPASETQSLASQGPKVVPQSLTGLQHTGDHGILNLPSAMEFQSILNGRPSRHVSQQEMNGMVHRNLPRLPTKELIAGEELWNLGHHSQRVLGTSPPFCFTSSGIALSNEVGRTGVPNGYPPRNGIIDCRPPARVAQLGWPNLPPTLTDHSLHISPQPPLLHMVAERQHLEMTNNALSAPRGVPHPQQEARRNEWQAIGSSNPSECQQSNSARMYSRSRRKLESKESTCELNIKELRHGKSFPRGREYSRSSSISSSRERGERWGSRSPHRAREKRNPPTSGQSLNNDGGDSEPISKPRDVKPPKRERERDQ